MLNYKTPGVYIEEQLATGPIAGVGTSTAVFVGPTLIGDVNQPTKITNWTQFKTKFGGFSASPRHYLPHAVRGFFDNGGTVAYIVGVGVRAFAELDEQSGASNHALRVEALGVGEEGNTITVEVKDAQIVDIGQKAVVHKAKAQISAAENNLITLGKATDAQSFRSGDWITIEGSTERAQIDRISGDQIKLAGNLTKKYDNTKYVCVADLKAGQKSFRVDQGAGIEAGSVLHLKAAKEENAIVSSMVNDRVTLSGDGLVNDYSLAQADPDVIVTTLEFTLVLVKGKVSETFPNLSMDSRHSGYFASAVKSNLVNVMPPMEKPGSAVSPGNQPARKVKTLGGSALAREHYVDGLTALEKVSDANMVCVPGRWDKEVEQKEVQQAVLEHCQKMGDRFAIFDAAPNLSPSDVAIQRGNVTSKLGYAALYYPWIRVSDPLSLTGEVLAVPPSGHLAGIYARSDAQRGVHKAPANEFINGALDLEYSMSDAEQGELNIAGINALRIFPGQSRPMVWGARTTTPPEQTAWLYVNVRRLFLFVEKSIQVGIRWAVFEPNDLSLWKKLDRTISDFLTRVWRSGALFGKTASEAFYVKIDEELNPPDVRALGQVIIEVGIAPVRPAEFVIVRIAMWDGGSQANES